LERGKAVVDWLRFALLLYLEGEMREKRERKSLIENVADLPPNF